jgi:hypothetical protein
VRELWSRLETAGVHTLATRTHGHHHPHLSYAVLRSWDLSRVEATLAGLPDAGPLMPSAKSMMIDHTASAVTAICNVVRQSAVTRTLASAAGSVPQRGRTLCRIAV